MYWDMFKKVWRHFKNDNPPYKPFLSRKQFCIVQLSLEHGSKLNKVAQ